MSFSREGIVWATGDGRWHYGLYAATICGPDPEWDVEYDTSRFDWVTAVPHATEDDAVDAYPGPNPGGFTCSDEPCLRLDDMRREAVAAGRAS